VVGGDDGTFKGNDELKMRSWLENRILSFPEEISASLAVSNYIKLSPQFGTDFYLS
jgi:hypothetical protein